MTDQSIDAVKLPNGVTLMRGGRVRVPKELIWDPEVKAAAARLGWQLEEGSESFASEVLCWPAASDEAARDPYREALEWIRHQCGASTIDDAVRVMNEAYETASRALDETQPCSTCGGRGWHTAGGNDPMACGRCPAGEAWESGSDEQRVPCPECQVERDRTGRDDIWCSSDECYVAPREERPGG